jgi:hypothetical protein
MTNMNTPDWFEDPLLALELKVARRADELSRNASSVEKDPLQLWCEAEREVLTGQTQEHAVGR